MNRIAELWRRIAFLFQKERLERELAEEMKLHLELRAAEREAAGAAPGDAEAEARRQFGNVTHLREASREVWGWSWLESLMQDLRYGARALAANRGFAFTAALSLALGIGANTAVFSVLNAVMLRSLPVEDPSRLVQVTGAEHEMGMTFTNPIWEQIRDHQRFFSGAFAYAEDRFDLADGGERRFARGMWVSGDFFRVLGVAPLRGRVFTPEDDRHGGGASGPVAVISHSFWQSHFAGDPAVIGRTVRLDRNRFEIVGVTPPWFTGLNVDRGFDVAIPIGCEPILHADQSALEHRSWWWLWIVGRLAPGTTMETAEARLQALAPEIHRATLPQKWEARDQQDYLKRSFGLRPAATGFSFTGAMYRKALFTLMAVVGLVLLIACANVANLLLARAAARQREISTRMAIGAGRRRIVRQLLTESLLLALIGAAAGLLFARQGSRLLIGLLSQSSDPLEIDVSLDMNVLAFTTGVGILTGILFGLAPALRATRVAPNQALKESARGATAGRSRFRLVKALVAAQVCLSLVLLVGAGLFLSTIRNLVSLPAGFDRRNVLVVRADTLGRVPKGQRTDLYNAIREKLRQVPGVESAAAASIVPVSNMIWNEFVYPEGDTGKSREDTLTYFNGVSPGYFATMRTPLLIGRDFSDRDTLSSPKVIILNESAARRYFGASSPLGRTVGRDEGRPGVKEFYEVVGVVKDSKYKDLREPAPRTAYVAMAQAPEQSDMSFVVRAGAGAAALKPSIRGAIEQVNRGVSLEFREFETQIAESVRQERTVALLSSFFGALALLLAAIGLYGVTSYAVARRKGEIAIRMALGASRRGVMGLVLRDVALMLAIGTIAGLGASLAAGRLITSLLFGVRPADPATLGAAALLLAAATAIAGTVPALRASRLDPTAALREE